MISLTKYMKSPSLQKLRLSIGGSVWGTYVAPLIAYIGSGSSLTNSCLRGSGPSLTNSCCLWWLDIFCILNSLLSLYFREQPFNTGWVWHFFDKGGGWIFLLDPEEFFFMPEWQTFLINVIKRLFSRKTIEFGYIKYELEDGWIFFYAL